MGKKNSRDLGPVAPESAKPEKDISKQADSEQHHLLPPKSSNRKYSIVVWGATGFTGSLVCKQLAETYPGKVEWAIAGRSEEKLLKLKEQLIEIDESCKDVPILTADLADPKSLDRLVKQSDVLMSTAGPFWTIGYPLIEAAVRNSTHYVDIAGEVHFIRKSIGELHDAAVARNVKIVHSCGFDSVPSDLGTLMIVEHMRNVLSRAPARINLLVNDIKGGQSGSSLQSMFEAYMLPPEEMERCVDPYCLDPVPAQSAESSTGSVTRRKPSKEETDQFSIRYNKHLKRWTYPFQFSPVNSRVVRRSAALLGYSPSFKYAEAHEAEGPVEAMLGAFGHTVVHLVATVPLFRSLVSPLLPKPGDGPPEAFRERNHWKFTLYGWTLEQGRDRPKQCQAVVSGRRDPGYLETGRMALEAALCLALQGEELKERGMVQGGVLTPATAMGSVLTTRLRSANIRFEITKTGNEVPTSPLDKLKAGPAGAAARSAQTTGAAARSSSGDKGSASAEGRLDSSAQPAMVHSYGADKDRLKTGGQLQSCRRPEVREVIKTGMAHAHPGVLIACRSCVAVANNLRHRGHLCVAVAEQRAAQLQGLQERLVSQAENVASSFNRTAQRVCSRSQSLVDAVL